MKILVLNGSPKGGQSNTFRITTAFLNGISAAIGAAAEIDTVHISKASIKHCKGCYCCWTATPGKCIIHDDMDILLEKIVGADIIIWSFPLYYYGMPSKLKALLDRNLPLNLPFISQQKDGGCNHPPRYENQPAKNILISTCGFCSAQNNYESLFAQFDIMFDAGYTKIICPEGELFTHPELRMRTNEYLAYAKQAGMDYAQNGRISPEMEKKLASLLYPPNVFLEMANASWDIHDSDESQIKKQENAAERFTKQMAATYNPASFDGTQRVFEIFYTDAQIGYQLILGKESCTIRTDNFTPYLTKVETPLTVWKDIAVGKYSGAQAMMEGKYKTLGDLKFLMEWALYFGGGMDSDITAEKTTTKKTNMGLMLSLWMLIWFLLPVNPIIGGVTGIIAASCMNFARLKWTLTIYDHISCFVVSLFSLSALLGMPMQIVVPLSYLCFGLMWMSSCLSNIPLSGHYSKNDYGDSLALKNPLFIKTNLILSLCWGILYIVTPIWTYFIMGSEFPYLTALVNSICPIFMGIFTMWFQKWYPSKIAANSKVRPKKKLPNL